MSNPGVKTKLVLYAPRSSGAVERLKAMRAGLPAGEVSDPMDLPLDGPKGLAFEYNSKMQLKGQSLAWALFACDGQAASPTARQTLLKGASGILLFPSQGTDGQTDLKNLESLLVGDFDYRPGKNYALGVVSDDRALADA